MERLNDLIRKWILGLVGLILVVVTSSPSIAKDLKESLEKLSQDAAMGYVEPIVSGFGTSLNGAWLQETPKPKKLGLDFELGLVAMGTFLREINKTFTKEGKYRFSEEEARKLVESAPDVPDVPAIRNELVKKITSQDFTVGIYGPTVVGSDKENVKVKFYGATIEITDPITGRYQIPSQEITTPITGLLPDATLIPFAMPQCSIGTLWGTNLKLRYLPQVPLDPKIGALSHFGWAIHHNPKVWFPSSLPFDIAALYSTQALRCGNIFKVETTAYGLNISKTLGPDMFNITPYAGFLLENSIMRFTYTLSLDTPGGMEEYPISFEMKGENRNRTILGLKAKVLLLKIFADYNIGDRYNSINGGLMCGF